MREEKNQQITLKLLVLKRKKKWKIHFILLREMFKKKNSLTYNQSGFFFE